MNFFEHQDQARKKIRLLVLLFILAVLVILAVANTVVMIGLTLLVYSREEAFASLITGQLYFSLDACLLTTTLVASTVTLAVVNKNASLRQGVQTLAESLGGRLVPPNTTNPDERRLLNIVAEMAIASGMPVPDVYVLKWEKGINAFAAGHGPSDAVIGVTLGCLEQLNRSQLQGIIAHQFGHILNGDVLLNMRLISILHGITFIGNMGYQLLRVTAVGVGARISKVTGRTTILLTIFAFLLIAVGWLGFFLGGLIRAALVRQREYLADAFAVQFTRNADGLKEALLIIGGFDEGSEIYNIHALEASHLFFCNALLRNSFLTRTHPPLQRRIRRIQPDWDGQYISRKSRSEKTARAIAKARNQANGFSNTSILSAFSASIFHDSVLKREQRCAIEEVRKLTQDPLSATVLCYAILLNVVPVINQAQKRYLEKYLEPQIMTELRSAESALATIPTDCRVALLSLCFPGLRRLSQAQYEQFRHHLKMLIKADDKISMFEWCVFQLIRHYLDKAFNLRKADPHEYNKIEAVATDFQIVLSMLVHEGTHDAHGKARAFGFGANTAGLYSVSLLPKAALSIDDFTRAVSKLSHTSPCMKDKVIRAMIGTARFDGRLGVMERAIVTTVAAAMDAPLSDALMASA